jgi:hypothetical protein
VSAKPVDWPGSAAEADILIPLFPVTGAALTRFIVPPSKPAKAAVRTIELFEIFITIISFSIQLFRSGNLEFVATRITTG